MVIMHGHGIGSGITLAKADVVAMMKRNPLTNARFPAAQDLSVSVEDGMEVVCARGGNALEQGETWRQLPLSTGRLFPAFTPQTSLSPPSICPSTRPPSSIYMVSCT